MPQWYRFILIQENNKFFSLYQSVFYLNFFKLHRLWTRPPCNTGSVVFSLCLSIGSNSKLQNRPLHTGNCSKWCTFTSKTQIYELLKICIISLLLKMKLLWKRKEKSEEIPITKRNVNVKDCVKRHVWLKNPWRKKRQEDVHLQ